MCAKEYARMASRLRAPSGMDQSMLGRPGVGEVSPEQLPPLPHSRQIGSAKLIRTTSPSAFAVSSRKGQPSACFRSKSDVSSPMG